MTLKIKHFIARNCEQFPQLYDIGSGGFLLYYPNAYYSKNLLMGCTHLTQADYLQAIKKRYEWENLSKQLNSTKTISIHKRLTIKQFFTPYEIDSLANYLSLKKGTRVL